MPSTRKGLTQENHHEEILRKLDSLAEEQKEIIKQLAKREHLDELVIEHEKSIKGNGKSGLLERVAVAEEREAKRDRREWFLYTLIIAELAGITVLYFKG